VPLLVAIPYAIRRKAARRLSSIAGLLLFAAIIAPWVWAVSREVPDFLHYVLVTETAARLATDELKRTGPPWYFVPYLVAGAAPWTIALLFNWKALRRRDALGLFLLLWIAVPLIFFSISQSKRPQYILPVMPAVALAAGWAWTNLRFRAAAIVAAVLGVILIGAAATPRLVGRMRPEIAPAARQTAFILGGALAVGGVVAAFARRRELALMALSLPMVALPAVANPLMNALGERRSARSLMARIAPQVTPQTAIVGVEAFTGSMAFYLRRTIVIATPDADELTSNYILRRYAQFSGKPGSPIKPLSWLDSNLGECCAARIFIVRDDDPHHQQTLEAAGAEKIATGPHHLLYRYSGKSD
jgi:4-amino-4-deoxy-L-arabinose transferase-like glycosyltransferase